MRESKEKEKAGAAINFKFLKHLTMHMNVGERGMEVENNSDSCAKRSTTRNEKKEDGEG